MTLERDINIVPGGTSSRGKTNDEAEQQSQLRLDEDSFVQKSI